MATRKRRATSDAVRELRDGGLDLHGDARDGLAGLGEADPVSVAKRDLRVEGDLERRDPPPEVVDGSTRSERAAAATEPDRCSARTYRRSSQFAAMRLLYPGPCIAAMGGG